MHVITPLEELLDEWLLELDEETDELLLDRLELLLGEEEDDELSEELLEGELLDEGELEELGLLLQPYPKLT